jgi:hypothetical protein
MSFTLLMLPECLQYLNGVETDSLEVRLPPEAVGDESLTLITVEPKFLYSFSVDNQSSAHFGSRSSLLSQSSRRAVARGCFLIISTLVH